MRQRSKFDLSINIGLHVARCRSNTTRRLYSTLLPFIAQRPINQTHCVDAVVYSFSSEKDVAEQVVSMRSFIRNVGIPREFVVVSDGSHSERSRAIICGVHPCVRMMRWDQFSKNDIPKAVTDYAKLLPMGKKLAVLMSMPVNGTAIYADSDVVFFPAAAEMRGAVQSASRKPRYLPDCQPTFDHRLLTEAETLNPVNAGFFMLQEPLDWRLALDRLEGLDGLPVHFTEQTVVHLTMRANQGQPFDADRYIVQMDDEYKAQDLYARKKIALRHYASPIRYKLWHQVG